MDARWSALTERPPPEAQRALWTVGHVMLGVGWVISIALAVFGLVTGVSLLGIAFVLSIPLFFTIVGALYRRPAFWQR